MKEDLTKEEMIKFCEVNMINDVEDSSEGENLMKEIMAYLQSSILHEDKGNAQKLRLKAALYTLVRGILYRNSFAGPLLRCLTKEEVTEVLTGIHSGVCGNQSGERSLAHKEITARYFWLYMMQYTKDFVKRCEKCQKHASLIHQYSEPCYSIMSPWPFTRWGMDVIEKLPTAKGGKCFVLLATDYFTN